MILRFILNNLNFKFCKYRKITIVISIIMIVFSVINIVFFGINLGIDFTGGILMEISSTNKKNTILNILKTNGFIINNSLNDGENLILYFKHEWNEDKIKEIKNILNKKLNNINYRKIDYIGPQIGFEQVFKAIKSIIIAIFGIFIYICIRFNLKCGFSGIVALLHDLISTVGFISLIGIEFNISSVIALLTIIGYSINNSVVIYDRIRDFQKSNKNNEHIDKIIDSSINITLFRTVLTSATTLLSVIPLILICTGSVRDFSLIIFFGIIIGTCSAIFISAPMLNFSN